MRDLSEKGYVVRVPENHLNYQDGKLWYILAPHHGIYRPQKKKLQLVFDCGASFQDTSLNNELLQGPQLANTLVRVLTHCIEHNMEEYNVHLFGATSSLTCANYTLGRMAEDNIVKSSPEAVATILNNFYIDDCLKSVKNATQAITLCRDLKALCA